MPRRGAGERVVPGGGLRPIQQSVAGVLIGLKLEPRGDARRHREHSRAGAPCREAREAIDPVLLRMQRVGAVGEGVSLPAIERGVGAGGGGCADGR